MIEISEKFTMKDLNNLSPACKTVVIENTIKENTTDQQQPYSARTLGNQNRKLAAGCRMVSKPIALTQYTLEAGEVKATGQKRAYCGSEIADIYVEASKTHGFTYFPLTGSNWKNIQQLVLFVKDGVYKPYARFRINEIINSESMSVEQLQTMKDISPVCNSRYKTILKISDVEVDNLPDNYIGKNGINVYQSAFLGSAPSIYIL